jgi:FHA domain/DUF1707 SHOCT-like domain
LAQPFALALGMDKESVSWQHQIMRFLLSPSPQTRVSAAERDHVADRLREACGEDRLSPQTFASRLDLLYSARTNGELRELTSDLPKFGFQRQLARIVEWAGECIAVSASAWGRANAPRLALPGEGSIEFGRSRDSGCVISDPTVSRHHATLTRSGRCWTLRDLSSTNGTYVNGARIADTASVRPGDEIWLGSSRFRLVQP